MLYHFYFKLNNPLKEATTVRYGLCDLFISENCHSFLKVIYIEPFVMIKVDNFILVSLSIKGFHNKTIMCIILALTFVYLLTIFVYLFIKGCKENNDYLQQSPKFDNGFFCWKKGRGVEVLYKNLEDFIRYDSNFANGEKITRAT